MRRSIWISVLTLAFLVSAAQAGNMSQWAVVKQTDFAAFGVGGMRNTEGEGPLASERNGYGGHGAKAVPTEIRKPAGDGTGMLEVTGIDGPVHRAWLVWHGPADDTNTAANATVSFNGQAVIGLNIGVSDDNCWGFAVSHAYVADVTALVPGNGDYPLSNFIKPDADINGASLLVFYRDGNAGNNRDVAVFLGNDSSEDNAYDDDGWNATLEGVNYSGGAADLLLVVGDGQIWDDYGLAINGTPYLPANGQNFQGDSVPPGDCLDTFGCLWDHILLDVTSEMTPGPNTLTLSLVEPGSDCVALVGAVFIMPAGSIPVTSIPTLTGWGLLLMAVALAGWAGKTLRAKRG